MADVKIYTTFYCGYCRAAKHLLDDKGVNYEEVAVDGDRKTRAWLKEETGQHTVPQIFINGAPIGGYTDAVALDQRGELDTMLAQV